MRITDLFEFVLEVDRVALRSEHRPLEALDDLAAGVGGEGRGQLTDEDQLVDQVEDLEDGVADLTHLAGGDGQSRCGRGW